MTDDLRPCGVSNALISQIETGKVKDPGFSTVVKLAGALGLSLERLAATVRPFTDTSIMKSRNRTNPSSDLHPLPKERGTEHE